MWKMRKINRDGNDFEKALMGLNYEKNSFFNDWKNIFNLNEKFCMGFFSVFIFLHFFMSCVVFMDLFDGGSFRIE